MDYKLEDFIGFTLGGKHSSELGIKRVSDGSRYNENLLPNFQDKTVQVAGGDGTYYFGSQYTQKPVNISIAFDNMSEIQMRQLKQICASKNMVKLIYDEAPYKYYMVKSTGTPQLKYLCFGEVGERIYKGEGTLNFVAYFPFARTIAGKKYLSDYNDDDYVNKNEWKDASRLKNNSNNPPYYDYPVYDEEEKAVIQVYNGGDIETDWSFGCSYSKFQTISKLECLLNNKVIGVLEFDFSKLTNYTITAAGVLISSQTNLIEGLDNNNFENGDILNIVIKSGSFFKIPYMEEGDNCVFNIYTTERFIREDFIAIDRTNNERCLFYDYLYY